MMPKGSFELMMIFFGLINSLATFQTMMNKILRDLINTVRATRQRLWGYSRVHNSRKIPRYIV